MSLQERLERIRAADVPAPVAGHAQLPGAAKSEPWHADPPASRASSVAGSAMPAEQSRLQRQVQVAVREELGPRLAELDASPDVLAGLVRARTTDLLRQLSPRLDPEAHRAVGDRVVDEVLGAGPLEELLRDDQVGEIMVNGHQQVFCERHGVIAPVAIRFDDDEHLRRIIDRIVSRVGRRVDESSPMVDARLPDGSRVNVVLPPVAVDGPLLTIRRFPAARIGMEDLVSWGSLTTGAAEFLRACVMERKNILISGGTGSGKTTTLGALAEFISPSERVVTVEDAAELRLPGEHVVRLEARPPLAGGGGAVGIRDLVRNALRMRPDRIIVGEVRDEAALDMLQAMNTGHEGSIGTVHANSPRDALSRIETMVLMAGLDLPVRVVREQIAASIDIVVQQTRHPDGSRRVTRIVEVQSMEGDVIVAEELFSSGDGSAPLRPTGSRPSFLDELTNACPSLPQLLNGPFSTSTRSEPGLAGAGRSAWDAAVGPGGG